jgi:hypothetical protein
MLVPIVVEIGNVVEPMAATTVIAGEPQDLSLASFLLKSLHMHSKVIGNSFCTRGRLDLWLRSGLSSSSLMLIPIGGAWIPVIYRGARQFQISMGPVKWVFGRGVE